MLRLASMSRKSNAPMSVRAPRRASAKNVQRINTKLMATRAASKSSIEVNLEGSYKLHRLDKGPAVVTTTNREELLGFYREMTRMRRMENAADDLYKQKLIRGFCHLYNGQEAVCSGIESELEPADHVVTAYRCHTWLITRRCNTPMKAVMAELTGRVDGTSRGKGGSMHLYNVETNFAGGNGIVGAQVPLGTGLAFAQKQMNTGQVTVCAFGDGAANQGQVYESYNMAKIWNLPIVYVVENNHYGMGTSVERASATTEFYTRGDYVPGMQVDGMNVLAVREAAKTAVEYAKKNGPIVLEAMTYRYKGHSMSDPGTTYRTRDEIDNMRKIRDPILYVENLLLKHNLATEEDLKAIQKEARAEVQEAVEFSKTSPLPPNEEWYQHVLEEDVTVRGRELTETYYHKPLSF